MAITRASQARDVGSIPIRRLAVSLTSEARNAEHDGGEKLIGIHNFKFGEKSSAKVENKYVGRQNGEGYRNNQKLHCIILNLIST